MTDSEYVLALDGTIGLSNSSILIKAHRERLRSIAARLATHPFAAAVLQQEAGEPVATLERIERLALKIRAEASSLDDYRIKRDVMEAALAISIDAKRLATTPQVSPPQARGTVSGDDPS